MNKGYLYDILFVIVTGTIFTLFSINKQDVDFNIIILTMNMIYALFGLIISNFIVKIIYKTRNK